MIDRREFLAGAGAAIAACSSHGLRAAKTLPTRLIPASGEGLPIVGLGNSRAFREGDLPLSRALIETLTEYGGSYIDAGGPGRETLARIMAADEARDELFIGTYIAAGDYASGRLDIAALAESQGGGPLDLVQTNELDDLARRWPFFDQYKDEGLVRYIGLARSGEQHFDRIMRLMAARDIDFVQVNYSLLEPAAAERLLPAAQDAGVAVVINRPFVNGRYFSLLGDVPLPAWAADFDCHSWAQFSLKFILSHPAVNCVLTETANPAHARENLAAGIGPLPDEATRRRMLALVRDIV